MMMPRRSLWQTRGPRRARKVAFSLIELLAVIAVIGILAALIIPSVASARIAINRARTKIQLGQWTLACAQFRQEYGFTPTIGTEGRLTTSADTVAFIRTLTGRNSDGSPVADPTDLGGNTRRITFLILSGSDLRDGLLSDAFGNTEIGVLRDIDGDGFIRPGTDGVPAAVAGHDGMALAPSGEDLPPAGVRAEVIFYSPGRGSRPSDLVLSWK